MENKLKEENKIMTRRILAVAVLIFLITFPVNAAVQATKVEVRGNVVNEPDTPALTPSWDGRSFAGFYYDLKTDGKTETLAITESLRTINMINSRTISKESLWYNTTKVPVNFKVNDKEGVNVLGSTTYQIVGWQGRKYAAVSGKANKLAKIVLEMDQDDKKTLTTGETWSLGSGYEMTINAIDTGTIPKQVWFTIKKNGSVVDEGIGQAPAGSTVADKQKAVYTRTMAILGQPDSLLFTVYVESIFSGATSDIVQFKYAWLIDAGTAKEIKGDESYGVFKVRIAGDNYINLSSDRAVGLPKNTDTTLIGDIKFRIADSDELRFYPFVTYNDAGTYEVRGTVMNEPDTPFLLASWDAHSFAGFYYDLKNNGQTETLALSEPLTTVNLTNSRTISKEMLWYNTTKVPANFKMFDKEGVNVFGSNTYQLVGWQGGKYVAVNGKANKLANLVLEMDQDEKKTLTIGETWSLGSGYEMTINAIDARTIPRQVWFTIKKNGAVIDEGIGQNPVGSTISDKQKAVYYKTRTILGESDSLLFTIYVDSIFSGATSEMVQFKYAWLIDESSAKEIRPADMFGVFKVRMASDSFMNLSSDSTISLVRNTNITLMGDMKFKVADSETLRFYPMIEYVVNETVPVLTAITVSPATATLKKGESATFTATTLDQNNELIDATVTWDSSNTSVGTIDSGTGLFKAVASGMTTISATSGSVSGTASANVIDAKAEIRGKVVDATATPAIIASWDAQSFAGFYYDLKNYISTEKLYFTRALGNYASGRSVDRTDLVYETGKAYVNFKAYEKEGVGITSPSDTNYPIVGWMGEKWIAVKNNSNKIAKLAFEMDKEDTKTLTTNETWTLGSGYELTINAIDSRTTPRQVWFTLKKDGTVVDEGIGQAPLGSSVAEKQKAVYYKTKTILGESDSLFFTIFVETIFAGPNSDMVQFKYAWLIDESTAKEIKPADMFGVFEVRTANNDQVLLSNENSISLYRNSETTIFGNMTIKVADSDTLRFYPFVKYTDPGTYEIRGSVVDAAASPGMAAYWDAQSFAGFYYDLNIDGQTETLALSEPLSTVNLTNSRSISKEDLWYNTSKVSVRYKMNEKENVDVLGETSYQLEGWQGGKYVAVSGKANKLAKLALEMGQEDKKTLSAGETWALGSGYELILNAIDARSFPRQVWFTLKKNGAVIDEAIVQAPASATIVDKQKAVYTKTMTILGESDSLLFTIYVDTIFASATSDMVQFKYAWLIDADTAKEIKSSDVYGVFIVRMTSDNFMNLSSDSAISLAKNTNVTLMGDIKFRVADSDTLRFYPMIEYRINESASGLTTIIVSPATATVVKGKTMAFTATTLDQNNEPINAIVTWGSGNTSVGTIDSRTGIFTAVAEGTTTITATSGSVMSNSATATVIASGVGLGDINGDKIIDYKDLGLLGASYGLSLGDTGYNPNADLNNDGIVNYKDLGILGAHYGEQI